VAEEIAFLFAMVYPPDVAFPTEVPDPTRLL